MKVLLVCAALLGAVMSEAPAPPQGWRPSGRLILLPARQENPPPAEYKPTSPNTTQASSSDEKEAERILDQGEYYVLLENGRLQMVKYKTSPLKQEEDKPSSDSTRSQQVQQGPASEKEEATRVLGQGAYYVQLEDGRLQMVKYNTSPLKQEEDKPSSDSSRVQQVQQVRQAEPFAQFQVEYFQFPQALPQPQVAQTKVEDKSDAEGYEANVQYRDVKPISAPIYAYNPAPLVRILKR